MQDPSLATKVMSYDAKSSFSDKGGGGCEEKNNPYSSTAEELELQQQILLPFSTLYLEFVSWIFVNAFLKLSKNLS